MSEIRWLSDACETYKISRLLLSFKTDISPTRLPSTLVSANHWSGRRPASFLHQDLDCRLPRLTKFFMSPVVCMVLLTTSPQSCRGILPPRLGNKPANLRWGRQAMQPLRCHLRIYHLSVQQCFEYNLLVNSVCFDLTENWFWDLHCIQCLCLCVSRAP